MKNRWTWLHMHTRTRLGTSVYIIGWGRVLLSHTLDAARSYLVPVVRGAGITEWPVLRGRFLLRTIYPARR